MHVGSGLVTTVARQAAGDARVEVSPPSQWLRLLLAVTEAQSRTPTRGVMSMAATITNSLCTVHDGQNDPEAMLRRGAE